MRTRRSTVSSDQRAASPTSTQLTASYHITALYQQMQHAHVTPIPVRRGAHAQYPARARKACGQGRAIPVIQTTQSGFLFPA